MAHRNPFKLIASTQGSQIEACEQIYDQIFEECLKHESQWPKLNGRGRQGENLMTQFLPFHPAGRAPATLPCEARGISSWTGQTHPVRGEPGSPNKNCPRRQPAGCWSYWDKSSWWETLKQEQSLRQPWVGVEEQGAGGQSIKSFPGVTSRTLAISVSVRHCLLPRP